MSIKTLERIKQGVNTANLLNHHETEIEPPKKIGLRFRFQGVIDKNIMQARIIYETVLPQKPKETYYESILKWGPEFSWLGLFNDISVGALTCKIEDKKTLYISAICVLEQYRRLGLATKLYEKVEWICQHNPDIKRIYVRVQVGNDAAIQFFEKLGYTQEKLENDYYHESVQPRDCYIYSKSL